MKRKAVSGIMLTLLFMGILSLTFEIQPVKAQYPIIYIKADGSIDPATANITSSDNVTYTFTDDINASIVVEKNNTVVDGAGYTVQGIGSGRGIDLSYRNNVTLKNVEVTNFISGIYLSSSSNNTLAGNTASSNNYDGIYLDSSSNNTLAGNTASSNNDHGILLFYSDNNVLFHNNLVSNTVQASDPTGYVNTWDDGYPSGGNYWSNYTGVDLNHDGMGDTEYVINANNTDYYPLMGMFHSFNTSVGKNVNIISNSTLEGFQYFESNSTIKMYVSNVTANQTRGFCRVSIPYEVMSEPFNVTIDGASPTYWNYTLYDNGTHRWIYFEYEHTTREIVIIPEFPSFLILPLFMIATLLAVIVYRRKHSM